MGLLAVAMVGLGGLAVYIWIKTRDSDNTLKQDLINIYSIAEHELSVEALIRLDQAVLETRKASLFYSVTNGLSAKDYARYAITHELIQVSSFIKTNRITSLSSRTS